jgi:leader peptidase (prepilin peptidase)/N-methyltransferase
MSSTVARLASAPFDGPTVFGGPTPFDGPTVFDGPAVFEGFAALDGPGVLGRAAVLDVLAVLLPLGYLAAVSVPLAIADLRTHRLPNAMVVPGLVVLAWAVASTGFRCPPAMVLSLAAALAVGTLFGAICMAGALGMGDVKLGMLLAGVLGRLGGAEPGRASRVFPAESGATAVSGIDADIVLHAAAVESVLALLAVAACVAAVVAGVQVTALVLSGSPVRSLRVALGPALLIGFWYAVATHLVRA